MSRGDWDREPREETRDGRPERRPRRGRARQAPPRTITLPRGHDREAVRLGTRTLWLSGKDSQVLTVVGRFGSAFSNDVRDTLYDGRQRHARRSLDKLQEQGLIDRREWTHARYQWGAIVTLTREGKRLLDRAILDDQRPRELDGHASAGWHKLREQTHDATLYYLYTQERARIEAAGGRVVSVQTERDLKASLFASTEARLAAGAADRDTARAEAAAEHQLPMVDGGVELPDLRLEIEHADGSRETRDLELATEHYHRGHLAGKQRAGFRVYGLAGRRSHARTAPQDGSRLTRLF